MAKRARRWCFTLNNPTDEEIEELNEINETALKRLIISYEVGSSQTPHLQGFVHFVNARTLTGVKRVLGSERYHLERTKGTDFEAWSYCTPDHPEKSPDNCEILLTIGDAPLEDEVELSIWERIIQHIDNDMRTEEIIRLYPSTAMRCISAIERYRLEVDRKAAKWRDLTVTYIEGPTGCGKTRYVMEKYGYANVYRVTNKKHPWDSYCGQEVIIFEEFRNSFKIEDMLNWLDGYPIELPARYADKLAKFTQVFIISNWSFYEQYESINEKHPETWNAWARRVHTLWDQHDLAEAKAQDSTNNDQSPLHGEEE